MLSYLVLGAALALGQPAGDEIVLELGDQDRKSVV